MGRKKIKVNIPTYNVDKLCEMVNEKYGLKPNQIGSIEHYQDMYSNSIVQICNQYRGTRVLATGNDPGLKQYLRNILDDRIILNFWEV